MNTMMRVERRYMDTGVVRIPFFCFNGMNEASLKTGNVKKRRKVHEEENDGKVMDSGRIDHMSGQYGGNFTDSDQWQQD